jgi:hypothetical protein
MRVNRGYLYWGVFFLTLGGAIVVVNAVGPDPTAVVDVLQYWPLAVMAIGVALVLRRTQFNVAGGMLAAAVPGLLLGSAIAVGPRVGWDCTPHAGELSSFATQRGTWSGAARVDVANGCGTLIIDTEAGPGWQLQAANTKGYSPAVDASASGLSVRSVRDARWFGDYGRDEWRLTLPTSRIDSLDVAVNAGTGRTDLAGAEIGRLALTTNAGQSTADLGSAHVESLVATVNAGQLAMDLPSDDVRGSVSINAGGAEICVPETVGIRVRSSGTFGSTQLPGLIQRDGAWESPDYASAAYHADLTVSVNLGNLEINPEGGCS